MTSFASLNGIRIVSGSLTIPLYGAWNADLYLATTDTVSAPAQVTLGNLTLTGFIFRQAAFAGTRSCWVVGGTGGWRSILIRRSYYFEQGVQLSTVLGDAARENGETVSVPVDRTLGARFVRESAQGSRLLRLLAGPNWYIDASGVTQIQAWPSTQVASAFTAINQLGGEQRFVIATEDEAAWLPNASFASPFLNGTFTASTIRYTFTGNGLFRVEVLAS